VKDGEINQSCRLCRSAHHAHNPFEGETGAVGTPSLGDVQRPRVLIKF
jgi:hypothetical protein